MPRLSATDIYQHYRPSRCALRVFLRAHSYPAADPTLYEKLLYRLGLRQERAHLAALGEYIDISEGAQVDRERKTWAALARGEPVIYQGSLRATWDCDGVDWDIVGYPDFLIREGDGYIIRDSKLSRRINERDHPEIVRQLTLYGWLYRQQQGGSPVGLQVHSGTGTIVAVEPNEQKLFADLAQIVEWKSSAYEFYEPVGWTKCGRCAFHDHCWPRALGRQDVSIVPGIDQGIVTALRALGLSSIDEFLERFDEAGFASLEYSTGGRIRRVGKRAAATIRSARALESQEEIPIDDPRLPLHSYYVMFDLEGIPAQLDELEKVYLWGMQVFGENRGPYLGVLAEAGHEGDQLGWERFLETAGGIFDEYGDVPFVHWHHYERTRLDMYMRRFGDPYGTATRVRRNLVDLLPILQDTVALPVPSYGLKVIEQYVGFERSEAEYGGDWAVVRYIEATETSEADKKERIIESIRAYNREDLEATWSVLSWLRNRLPAE